MVVPYKGDQEVTEKEALQNAADEARKAARAGREFAGLLDDYAKYLTQPNWRQRADDTYRSALNKLNVINEGMAACHKIIEASAEAAAADSLEQETLKQTALQQEIENEAVAKQEITEKSKPRSIRIAKKAAL
jgi:hypothetical protein